MYLPTLKREKKLGTGDSYNAFLTASPVDPQQLVFQQLLGVCYTDTKHISEGTRSSDHDQKAAGAH